MTATLLIFSSVIVSASHYVVYFIGHRHGRIDGEIIGELRGHGSSRVCLIASKKRRYERGLDYQTVKDHGMIRPTAPLSSQLTNQSK